MVIKMQNKNKNKKQKQKDKKTKTKNKKKIKKKACTANMTVKLSIVNLKRKATKHIFFLIW